MGTVNISKLKGCIAERGISISKLAELAGIEHYAMYRKMKDAGRLMTIGDANRISAALELTDEEKLNIFFSLKVA